MSRDIRTMSREEISALNTNQLPSWVILDGDIMDAIKFHTNNSTENNMNEQTQHTNTIKENAGSSARVRGFDVVKDGQGKVLANRFGSNTDTIRDGATVIVLD